MIILRDWTRTQSDDFRLNVEPILENSENLCAVYLFDKDGTVLGWKLISIYE